MYENLERELNNCPEAEYGCSRCEFQKTLNCREHLMKKAADAIEELVGKVEQLPRWIPVTEQKPPLPEDEDVCWVQVIGAVKGRKEAEPILYSRAYRLRDGKRVRIERFVGDGGVLEVTHWMLMPEPPKEEAKNFCGDCHWYEAEEMYCFRQGCHAYDESSCEFWEPMPADEPIPAPAKDINAPTTYDLLYEEGGAGTT